MLAHFTGGGQIVGFPMVISHPVVKVYELFGIPASAWAINRGRSFQCHMGWYVTSRKVHCHNVASPSHVLPFCFFCPESHDSIHIPCINRQKMDASTSHPPTMSSTIGTSPVCSNHSSTSIMLAATHARLPCPWAMPPI